MAVASENQQPSVAAESILGKTSDALLFNFSVACPEDNGTHAKSGAALAIALECNMVLHMESRTAFSKSRLKGRPVRSFQRCMSPASVR